MKARPKLIAASLLGAAIGGWQLHSSAATRARLAFARTPPAHAVAQPKDGGVVVELCDGVTNTEVKGLKPGQRMSHAQALAVTGKLMREWQRKHPGQHWLMAQAGAGGASQAAAQATPAASGSRNIAGPGGAAATRLKSQQGDTYASFHQRDYLIWKAQTDAFVEQGNKIFHSAELLGSTIGVSCDMCHPNAANIHPETYPKYQEQLQRVALLRDMIDWCIENPVKGKTLDPNDPKMRALEAYILAQRKGIALDYGKH